jgi:gamma-glutamyltranspeptidase/glutathione hydrolase
VDVPLKGLFSDEYARELAGQINPDRASLESDSDTPPWAYYESRALHDPWPYEGKPKPVTPPLPSAVPDGDCTTHFGVADRHGNLVSCTQTAVSSFGSKVMTGELGILWNNGMIWFNAKPGAANSIAPWKRPLVNAAPLLVTKRGKSYVSIGSPGGRKVNNANTNVALNVLDFGMGPQEAITVPRADASGSTTQVDARVDPSTVERLRQMGHNVEVIPDIAAWYSFARPSAVMVDAERGTFRSGSDPAPVPEARGF